MTDHVRRETTVLVRFDSKIDVRFIDAVRNDIKLAAERPQYQ